MERLTEWNGEQPSHAYYPRCFKAPCYGDGCKINDCLFETAVCDRLAAYEDTGLTPEEVSALVKDWSDIHTIVGECGGLDRVKKLAEADVVPVRHGRWIIGTGENGLQTGYRKCSRCGEIVKYGYSLYGVLNFCNYCGAKMDGDDVNG